MTEMEKLQQMMSNLDSVPSVPSVPSKDEYSGPDGPDGMTVVPADPILDTTGAPTAPPVTAAQRGKTLSGTKPAAPEIFIPEAAVPIPAGLRMVFTGVTGSGKSSVAKQLGLIELQIQDSIRDLYHRYFPGQEPPADFVNTLLVWGEGVVDPKTPVTPARMLFVDFVRKLLMPQSLNFEFGERGFWQKMLINSANRESMPVAVTTCTTQALLDELKSNGFQHFHIACSNQTLGTRKRRVGANDQLAVALSNQLVREVSMRPQGGQLPCIWNDTVPAPSPRFLTLETARQMLQQSQNSIITGE
jgi:hypothetical protein